MNNKKTTYQIADLLGEMKNDFPGSIKIETENGIFYLTDIKATQTEMIIEAKEVVPF